jgi:protein SCO1/2
MFRAWLIVVVLLASLANSAARAQSSAQLPAALREVRFDQRLNEQVPLDLEFRDEAGQPVKLARYFGERPVILVLAYYQCPMLCTQVLNGLVRGMMEIPFTAGRDFEVLTVSFDPRETPELAAAKKRTYVTRYGRPEAEQGWHFLTGEAEPIRRLTEAVGFHYTYDERSGQFAHASGILVLTPAGNISRYFYDISYPGRDLRLGLVEASQGTIGSPVEQIMLFCFHYDPTQGRYGTTIMTFVRAGGVLTMLLVGMLLAILWKAERHTPPVLHGPSNVPSAIEAQGGS